MASLKFPALLVLLSLGTGPATRAQSDYSTSYDSKGTKILVGQIDEKTLANDKAFMWFFTRVDYYRPDTQMVRQIGTYRNSFYVVGFMGTWDSPSRQLVPQFYKVMLMAGFQQERITLYGVGHDRKTSDHLISRFRVKSLPTFIFIRNGSEIGRISGSLHTTMEGDILKILDPGS